MLFPVPYEVPEKKAKRKAKGTRDGLRRKGASDTMSEDVEDRSSVTKDDEEEEDSLMLDWAGLQMHGLTH